MKRVLVTSVAAIVGGSEKGFLTSIPLLQRKGYDFIFIFPEKGPAIDEYRKIGVKCIVVEDKGRITVKKLTSIIHKYNIDLIHNNHINMEAAEAARGASKALGTPQLFHLHGKISYNLEGYPPRLIRKRVSSVCELSDFVIGVSEFITNQLNGFIDSSKLKCLYSGVPITKTLLPKQIVKDRAKMIGMVAHFYPLKQHEDFIMAAKYLLDKGYNANFFIAGNVWMNDLSQECYLANLKNLIKTLGLQNHFTIYQGLKDITHLYQSMDIFVLPSVDEGFSRAILEAMQFAIPVVVTNSGGNPEAVTHRKNGFLVPAKEPKKIAQTIIKLLKDENLVYKIGQNARSTVKKHFTLDRFAKELASVYNSLI